MQCKYCDNCTGMCTNPESPVRADECPVPDVEGVCKHEKRADPIEDAYRRGAEDMRKEVIATIKHQSDLTTRNIVKSVLYGIAQLVEGIKNVQS